VAFVTPSVVVHLAIAWLLPALRERKAWTPQDQPVEIDIARPVPRKSAPVVAPPVVAGLRAGSANGSVAAGLRARGRSSSPTPPAAQEPPSPEPTAPLSKGPVELFPDAVLGRLTTAPHSFGGTTRREGDGRPPPGSPDAAREAAEVSGRVGRFLREAGGEGDTVAGRVDPAWRDLERQIDAHFHPRAEQITSENAATLMIRQLGNPPSGGRTPRGIDPSRAAELAEFRADQIAACQRAAREPAQWKNVEIEVIVDAAGNLESVRVLLPSGRAELDRHALDAVRRAAGVRPTRDPRGRTRSRWSVEAAVAVTPPTVNPIVDPTSGKVTGAALPGLSFTFDESLGKIAFDYPFKKEVRTHVRLLAVEPMP
jgi:TonB family protein